MFTFCSSRLLTTQWAKNPLNRHSQRVSPTEAVPGNLLRLVPAVEDHRASQISGCHPLKRSRVTCSDLFETTKSSRGSRIPGNAPSTSKPLHSPPSGGSSVGNRGKDPAYPQQIVTTRLLYCLQDRFAQLSRLQRI